MRFFVIGLLFLSVAAGACTGREPNAGAATPAEKGSNTAQSAAANESAKAVGTVKTVQAPAFREVTIPAGTSLPIVLDTAVGSDTSEVEDPVRAHLARAITIDGATVVPAQSVVLGSVTDATRSGKVKGRAHLSVRFDSLIPADQEERYAIHTSSLGRTAPGTKKNDALKIAAPAAGGAIVGGLIGGGKGAAIGTAAGGGAGTAVVLSTRGKEVRLGRGAAITIELVEPLIVRVRS
jgi:hypothetical protein